MLTHITRRIPHYMVLLGIFAFGLWGLVGFSYEPVFQTAVIISVSVSFVVWGIVHHFLHENLHIRLVAEYAAVAALGAVILLSLVSPQ